MTPPERPKNSCGLAVVVLEQPAEPFLALYWPFRLLVCVGRRKQDHVALTLMRALFMMGTIQISGQHVKREESRM